MDRFDIAIMGGGFAGLTTAAALAGPGRRIVVFEARAGIEGRFRGELIHPIGTDVLAELGVLPRFVEAGGVPIEGYTVLPERDGPGVMLPYAEITGRPQSGIAMNHPAMVACLRAHVASCPGVEMRFGERIVDVLRSGERVTGVRTASGDDVHADLTIAADGRSSKLRSALGIGHESRLLSMTAALLLEGVQLPHPRHGHVMIGTPGPVLAYPVGGDQVRMCIDLPTDVDKGREAMSATIARDYAPHMPEALRRAMLRALPKAPLELCANHAITTRQFAAAGWALVGDAGGCSHPLTATGMTIALNDARLLSTALAEHGAGDAALAQYARRRLQFVRAREILADALYNVFAAKGDAMRHMRRGILRYWAGGARARGHSMALLSGRESRSGAFAAEYARVIAHAMRSVAAETEPSMARASGSALLGLLQASYKEGRKLLASACESQLSTPPSRRPPALIDRRQGGHARA